VALATPRSETLSKNGLSALEQTMLAQNPNRNVAAGFQQVKDAR